MAVWQAAFPKVSGFLYLSGLSHPLESQLLGVYSWEMGDLGLQGVSPQLRLDCRFSLAIPDLGARAVASPGSAVRRAIRG